MAADKHSWQNYNFPFSGQENVSQSFIDYGSASVLNIDLDERDLSLVMHSKQWHDSRLQRLVAKQPSLPFLEPNQRSSSLTEETLNDYQLSGCSRRDQLNFNTSTVDNFSTDHPDVMYGSVVDLLQQEMNHPPWSTCGNNMANFHLPWRRRDDCCNLCSNIHRASMKKDSNSAQVLKHLETTLPDISPALLENLLQESNASEISSFYFDTFKGNSLCCHALEAEHQALLIYPSGPGLDILNFSHISHFPQSMVFDPVLSKKQFSIQGQIRQIEFSSYSHNNIVIGSRSQYNCTFFQSCTAGSEVGDLLSLKCLETVALTRQAMCIAVSPYIPGEGIVVTETGGTYHWTCDHALNMICPGYQSGRDSPWYQCVFADNPRCIVMADSKGMDLLDFRAGTLFQRFFFSIPSDQVDSFECISAIARHPQNVHHYVLATDQSLMILDDRFLQHPVLKWRHHNEDPIQFINVACDVIPQCDDTIVMISGSRHGQTHCFQYSDNQVTHATATSEQSCLPPQSTSLPWKVSPYNEWYYTGFSSNPTSSPAISSRLSQSLIGVCTMPHTLHAQKGFTVFQMSSAGDLFYQPFISQDSIDSEEGHIWSRDCSAQGEQELSTEAKILCQKWIDMTACQMDDFTVKLGPYQVDSVEADKKDPRQDLLLLPVPHPSCVLCNDRQTAISSQRDQESCESSICETCGLDTSYSSKLVENQINNRVITRSSLSIQHEVTDLTIVPDFNKATDPLSKSLWVNWNSDEPIPVYSDEPIPVYSDEPMPVYSDEPIPVYTYSDEPMPVNSDEPIPVYTYSDEPIPLNCDEPILENSNKPMPGNNKAPLSVFSSEEQEAANQNIEDRTAGSEALPSQDAVTSVVMPLVLSQVNKIPIDGELKRSPSKQGVPSSTQCKSVENSPKKLKIVKRRTGHVMGF